MKSETPFQKFAAFFLTRIFVGIAVVGGIIALLQWGGGILLGKMNLDAVAKDGITGIVESVIAVIAYIMLYGSYEKRKISELSFLSFTKYANPGFFTGFMLQSLFIFVIFLARGYRIVSVNQISSLLPALALSLTAGFVAEIILRGILFRLIEEKFGSAVAIIVFIVLFAVIHGSNAKAPLVSVAATTIQAGFLLSAAFVYSRSLWLPIFIHFSWDFTEPGIFGGVNPGMSVPDTLFESKISGHELLTGGNFGPGNSIQSCILCLIAGILFLRMAKKKNNIISFRSAWNSAIKN